MDFNINFSLILIQAPVILFALTVHEYSHALIASKLGDDTAKDQGRLTLNPIAHLDVLGTLLMFIVGFGWAKPVPVNASNFDDPKRGMLLVAIAGPISNLLMAIAAAGIIRFVFPSLGTDISSTTQIFVVVVVLTLQFGVALAIFNMLPVPPLDGSRVIYGILPDNQAYYYSRFEPYGVMLLFGLFIFGGEIFTKFVWFPVSKITEFLSGYNYFELWNLISQLIS